MMPTVEDSRKASRKSRIVDIRRDLSRMDKALDREYKYAARACIESLEIRLANLKAIHINTSSEKRPKPRVNMKMPSKTEVKKDNLYELFMIIIF